MRPLFLTPTVSAVGSALDAAAADGLVAVIDWPRLGRQLAERGRRVVQIAGRAKALRRQTGDRLCADVTHLPLAAGSLAAVVMPGLATREDWQSLLAELHRVARDGGLAVFVDRAAPTELTRRALCGGLSEIEQRVAGRTVVTSGRVFALPASAAATRQLASS